MNLRIDIPYDDDEISQYPKPLSMLRISELHNDKNNYIKNLTWNDVKIKNKNLCNIIIEKIINKICDSLNK